MTNVTMQEVEKAYLKKDVPQFEVGDTVDVATRIVEGDKERTQIFSGTVIMKKGTGMTQMFTVRRIVNNEGVERIFPVHSPFVAKVTVKRSGQSRRAKLFYLRDRVGKSVRLVERRKTATKKEQAAAASAEAAKTAETPELAASAAT